MIANIEPLIIMKHGHTIITLFAAVSLGALTLWAIHDLWIVIAVIVGAIGIFSTIGQRSKN
jgi:hypothetical protein